MGSYPLNRYVPGTHKRECDVCGFDFLRSQLRRRWDGVLVCQADYDEKDPQLTKHHTPRSPIHVDPRYDNATESNLSDAWDAFGTGDFGEGIFGE